MSDPTTTSTGVQWGIALPGLLLVLVGGAAYLGVAKSFWRTLWPRTTLGFGLAWIGLSGLVTGLGWPAFAHPWGALVGLLAMVCFVIGLLSFVWMARPLQARWYRDEKASGVGR